MIIPDKYKNTTNKEYRISHKVNSEGNYTIKFFDKTSGGIHLHKIQIKRLLPKELQTVYEYFEECKKYNVDIELFSFSEYRLLKKNHEEMNNEFQDGLLNIDDINEEWLFEEHFLKKLFDDGVKLRSSFLNNCDLCEKEFMSYRNKIQEINGERNTEELTIDSTLSDVFGTTTMEGQKESEEEIKELLKKNNGKITLLEQEAKNILKGFEFVSKNHVYQLDINNIKRIHGILTKDLDDNHEFNGLNYKSTEFRNEVVNIGLFRGYDGNKSIYTVPLNANLFINELISYLNSLKEIRIFDIAFFHFFFYSTHPFWNGNKRTTRVIESGLIQQFFDKEHLTLGMGYYFKMNINKYFSYIKSVLSGEISISSWFHFYLESFADMGKESLKRIQEKSYGRIYDYLNGKNKLDSYGELDELMFNFYVKNIGNEFTKKELKEYLKNDKKILSSNINQKIDRRIEKHINDGLIIERGFLEKRYRIIFHKKNKKEL